MKKIRIISIVLSLSLVMLCLTGCVGLDMGVNINEDGTGQIECFVGMTERGINFYKDLGMDVDISNEVVPINGKIYYGDVEHFNFASLDEVNKILSETFSEYSASIDSTCDFKFTNKNGVFNFNLDINSRGLDVDTVLEQNNIVMSELTLEEMSEIEHMMDEMMIRLVINFPYNVEQLSGPNRGVTVQGKTVTLDMLTIIRTAETSVSYSFVSTPNTISDNKTDKNTSNNDKLGGTDKDIPSNDKSNETDKEDKRDTSNENDKITDKDTPIENDKITDKDTPNDKDLYYADEEENSNDGVTSKPAPLHFNDIEDGEWYYNAVMSLAYNGIVQGYGMDMFGPNTNLTYGHFCKIIERLKSFPEGEPTSDYWAYNAIKICIDRGYIKSLGDIYSVNYDVEISREVAISGMFLAKYGFINDILGVSPENIPDYEDISDEYKDIISKAYAVGIINGVDEKGTFLPKKTLTRAEACQIFYNAGWTSPEVNK